MRALHLVGLGLATLRLVDTAKEALPVIPPPAAKSTAAVLIAGGLSFAYRPSADWRDHVLLAGAAAGLASLLHDAQATTRMVQDSYIAGITIQARRTTPLGS
jgi:hypothetical protein